MSHPPPIDPAVRAHVQHVLDTLLQPGELDDWVLSWEPDRGTWRLVARVTVCGEECYGYVTEVDAAYPLSAGLDTFTDGFEDFIAESRFAWGQQRELRDRPWRD